MARAKQPVLGVDIGGTKVAAGLVNAHGEILSQTRSPMVSRQSAEAGLQAVVGAIKAALVAGDAQRAPKAIGLISPGPLDPRAGIVLNPPNLPCWREFPLAEKVEQAFGLPTRLDNDANAAALAEALWGAATGHSSVFYATLGTGVGTSIVLGGRIYHGRTGLAAEGGHVSIDYRGPRCACGKQGCIETLVAGPAIARRARERLAEAAPRGAAILEMAAGKIDSVTTEMVAEAYRAGDALATEILQETADFLAIWLGNIIDLLEPDVIVFGGGLGQLMSEWFDHIRGRLPSWSINPRCQEIPLVAAKYGEDSGIAGAAALHLAPRQQARPSFLGYSNRSRTRTPYQNPIRVKTTKATDSANR